MDTFAVRNRSDYDRKWFGISATIGSGETEIDREKFDAFNKNCVLFQQMTNPPEGGGQPMIQVIGSSQGGEKVVLNGQELDEAYTFSTPKVLLKGGEVTRVPKKYFMKLKDDSRFQSLVDEHSIDLLGWNQDEEV